MRATSPKPSWLRTFARAVRSTHDRQDLVWELKRRRSGEPALPPFPIRKVMVICQGNICRSPFAERQLAKHCPQLEVRSAGLKARNGDPAQPAAARVGLEFGVTLDDHAAHLLRDVDVEWADLILGMQGWHQASVHRRWPKARERVRLLGDFLADAPHTIEDPWGAPDDYFHGVFEQIARANTRIAELLDTTT